MKLIYRFTFEKHLLIAESIFEHENSNPVRQKSFSDIKLFRKEKMKCEIELPFKVESSVMFVCGK